MWVYLEKECSIGYTEYNKGMMGVRLESLLYFIEVARTGSISRACETLYLSQQNLSAAIKKLETETGYPLLKRHHSGVSLTPYGKLFLEMATQIQEAQSQFQARCQELNQDLTGELSIHLIPLANDVFGPVISQFAQLNPSVRLNVEEGSLPAIFELFAAPGRTVQNEIALIAVPPFEADDVPSQFPGLEFTTLRRDPFCVCVSRNSPLAGYKTISMAEFAQSPIISYTAPHGLSPIMQEIIRTYDPANIVLSSSNLLLCFQAALQGRGAFLVPMSSRENPMYQKICDELVHIPIREDISFLVGYLSRADLELTPLTGNFLNFLKSHFVLK